MHTCFGKRFTGGLVNWRVIVLHYVAKALGILVHVEGFPYGSRRNFDLGCREDFREGAVFKKYSGHEPLPAEHMRRVGQCLD